MSDDRHREPGNEIWELYSNKDDKSPPLPSILLKGVFSVGKYFKNQHYSFSKDLKNVGEM
jgi:hypothetical protein